MDMTRRSIHLHQHQDDSIRPLTNHLDGGGDCLYYCPAYWTPERLTYFLERAKEVPTPVRRTIRGTRPGLCHLDSAKWWKANGGTVWTGLFLFDDMWYEHSWVYVRKTQTLFDPCPAVPTAPARYFGVPITTPETGRQMGLGWCDEVKGNSHHGGYLAN